MKISTRLLPTLVVTLFSISSLPALADNDCRLEGSYGYRYDGTSFSSGPTGVSLAETGFFTIGRRGVLTSSEGTPAFYFSDFGGAGPLWLLIHEVRSDGNVTPDANNPCSGTLDFLTTGTVTESSNPALVPEGTVLFEDSPRSINYTISGLKHEIVDLMSSSPGTIASGTAHKRRNKGRNKD